jgi:colicin import membrane protein
MYSGPKSYILPVILALLLHGGLVVITASTWFDSTSEPHRIVPQHIKAELVDLRSQNQAKEDAQRQADAIKQAEAKKQAAAKARAQEKKAAAAKAKAEAQKVAERKAEADKKAKQELADKTAAKKKAEQLAADAKLKQAAKDKAAADALAAAKKQDQLKKAEQKRQADAQRKAEQAEKDRQAREKAEQLEILRLEAQAKAEQAWAAKAEQLVASAEAVIISRVQSQWRRPPSARNGMVVGVRIHLLPTGEVDDAYVTDPSGDEAFDRSAVNAVLKAERFPELQVIDPVVFDRYLRQISLKFRPEDLRR